jgi:hypothetical protein
VDYAAEFVRIAGLGLVGSGQYKLYYSLLTDNLRRYLQERLEVDAMERTSDELLALLEQAALPEELRGEIGAFLTVADLVKFARAVPDRDHARRAPETGVGLVQRIDRLVAQRRQAALEAAAREAQATSVAPVSASGSGSSSDSTQPRAQATQAQAGALRSAASAGDN